MKTILEAIRDCYPILCSQSDLEGVTFNFDQVQALMKYYAEHQAVEQDRWVAGGRSRNEIELKVSVIISATNTSGNKKLGEIMQLFDSVSGYYQELLAIASEQVPKGALPPLPSPPVTKEKA